MRKPDSIETNSNYHLFKKVALHSPCHALIALQGIKPMWEDEANAKGGKWVINLKSDKNMLNTYWENMVLGMIGETIDVADEITGAVVKQH